MKKLIYSHGETSGIGPDLIITLCKTNYWAKLKYPLIIVGDPKLFIDRAELLKKNVKIISINWRNRKKGKSKFKINELSSKYIFTLLYCFFEKILLR